MYLCWDLKCLLFFSMLREMMLGRDRSTGRSDGSTSLTVDIILIYFLRFPYVSVYYVFHLKCQTLLSNWLRNCIWSPGAEGPLGEFSCLDCLMDTIESKLPDRFFAPNLHKCIYMYCKDYAMISTGRRMVCKEIYKCHYVTLER